MSKTCHAFGRDWCHQQFYGLLRTAMGRGLIVSLSMSAGKTTCVVDSRQHSPVAIFLGGGETPWEALADALEKREGTR